MMCMVVLQNSVFENLVRNMICISSTGKHRARVSLLAAGIGELLYCERSFNALECMGIFQNDLLSTNKKLLSKEE